MTKTILCLLLLAVCSLAQQDSTSTERLQNSRSVAIRGRVLHAGEAVAGVKVMLAEVPLPEGQRRTQHAARRTWITNSLGEFVLPVSRRERHPLRADVKYVLSVWHNTLGASELEPLSIDPASPPQELVLEITRAPGAVAGRVLFPDGHGPREILLATERGLIGVHDDGTFLLPGLRAGPMQISCYQSGYSSDAPSMHSTSTWFSSMHRIRRIPTWCEVDPHFEVEVIAGKMIQVTLDLSKRAQCFIEGRLVVDGRALALAATEAPWPSMRFTPQVLLLSYSSWRPDLFINSHKFVAATQLDQDGRFRLGVHAAGKYLLAVQLREPGRLYWDLQQVLELKPGSLKWEHDLPSGELLIRSQQPGQSGDLAHWMLRTKTPAGLHILAAAPIQEPQNLLRFPMAPVGNMALFQMDRFYNEVQVTDVRVQQGQKTELVH